MKKMYQGLMIIAMAALVGCSSMEVNDVDAVAENYPSDFDGSVYLQLHPVLLTMQIQDYVADRNAKLKASMDADAYKALVAEDSLAFVQDTASLRRFYTSSRYADFPQEKWDSLWIEKQDTNVIEVKETVITKVTLDSLDSAGTAYAQLPIYVDSVAFDTAGMIQTVYGKLDTTEEAEAIEVEIDKITVKVDSKSIKRDTVTRDSIEITPVPPGIDKSVTRYTLPYNIYGVDKDIDTLNVIIPDAEAATLQFVAYGQSHGWAYRRCHESEKGNEEAGEVTYPTKKLYCDDNGVVREIK